MKSRTAGSLPSARIGAADYRPPAQWHPRLAFSTASYLIIWELFGLGGSERQHAATWRVNTALSGIQE